MVLKVIRYEENSIKNGLSFLESGETFIIDNVKSVRKHHDIVGSLFIEVELNDGEFFTEPICIKNEKGDYPSLVQQMFLMNEKGQTIERLV